ncbi:outer membrane channel protein TolC, partial [Vibrio alfacsensis]
ARAQYDSVLAQEIQAKNNVENEYEELRAITGQQASNLAVLDTARFSTSLPRKNADQLVAQATNDNLDLVANRIQKDVAKEQISLAQSG